MEEKKNLKECFKQVSNEGNSISAKDKTTIIYANILENIYVYCFVPMGISHSYSYYYSQNTIILMPHFRKVVFNKFSFRLTSQIPKSFFLTAD